MSRTILYGIMVFNLSIGTLALIGTVVQTMRFAVYLKKWKQEMNELYRPKQRKDR